MGGGAGQQTTTSVPWGPQQAPLAKFFSEAERLYGDPKRLFPGSMITERDALSFGARDRTANLGTEDYRKGVTGFLGDLMGGQFLQPGASNPYLDQLSEAYGSKASEQYKRITAPTTATRFARAGRSGSDAYNKAVGQNERNLAEGLTRANADIYKGDFDTRFAQMLQGVSLSGQAQAMELQDIAAQRGQGQIEENYMQRLLDEQIQRFNFIQEEPEMRLDRLGQRVRDGGGFGTTTVSGLPGSNQGAQVGLGIASILASLAGTALFGPVGGLGASTIVNVGGQALSGSS